jgi:large subunit ribosomal protein L10e
MKLRIYPHHILRENKQAQGAHADRIQTGMSHAFGKNIGRAARVRPNQKILSILVDESGVESAKKALKRAKSRITCAAHIEAGTDVKSIGTKPRKFKIKEEKVKEVAEEKEAEKEGGKEEKEGGKEAEKKEGKEKKGKEEAPKKEEKPEKKGKK